MLTIGQLAAYAGVTARTVRLYHQIVLLPEPERMLDLLRERGWTGWTRLERLAEPPG